MKTLREYLDDVPVLYKQLVSHDAAPFDDEIKINHKLWWWCDKYGCAYDMSLKNKLTNPSSCSVCNGSRVFTGFNDLLTVDPVLASEWDNEKNDMPPSEVKFSSSKHYWFRCGVCSHSFRSRLSQRIKIKTGCPKCVQADRLKSRGLVLASEVDGDMGAMFRGEANKAITSTSQTLVNWECSDGHMWEQAPRDFKGCPFCSGERMTVNIDGTQSVITKPVGTTIADVPSLAQFFDESNSIPSAFLSVSSARHVAWLCTNKHRWNAPVYSMKRSVENGFSGCPQCTQIVSNKEKELVTFIRSVLPDDVQVVTNDRSLIAPKELDVYIPELGVAVEFNGLYWHDDSHVPNGEHARKLKLCAERGVQLITVWEDDWLYRRSVVESMLKHKLGVSEAPTVYARKTTLNTVRVQEVREFCEKNHIQGFVPGTLYLGLYDALNNLVAVSIWRKNKNTLYLERYCTSVILPGGMGKLLKHAKVWATEQGFERFVTFSDHVVSNGKLYQILGFTLDAELPPDYMYVVNKKRVHKFNYRKKRFRQDPNLQYEDGLSESELATLNNIPKIYDCGKTRWVINLKNAS